MAENEASTAREMTDPKERRFKETLRLLKETERLLTEPTSDADREIQETEPPLTELEEMFTSRWSRLLDRLVERDLVPLLEGRGIAVRLTWQRSKTRRYGRPIEFDLGAVSDRELVLVEVRPSLCSEDVTDFLSRLPFAVAWFSECRGKRVLGAVAYHDSDSSVTEYAERQGLLLIRATHNSASIVNEPEFAPRVFS